MNAYVFPGQGAQFVGMGLDLYEKYPMAKELFQKANAILGFEITEVMFNGTAEGLRETKVTQPAIFLHSVILRKVMGDSFKPDMVAGHSLGEFSALVANNTLSFEDGLTLVAQRALAMQKACDITPGTMAAVLKLEDEVVERICAETNGIVVAANYNCPGQLVISGEVEAINLACATLKEAKARAMVLPVGGAFHSPLMEPAREELAAAIESTSFETPSSPIYQNVTAMAVTSAIEIKKNLMLQLTAPVRWNQSVQQMVNDGATVFTEIGPGKVLQGLIKKIAPTVATTSAELS